MATISVRTIRYLLNLYHDNPKDYNISALEELIKDKPDETPLNLFNENDFIAVKRWSKDDFLADAKNFLDDETPEPMRNLLPVYDLLENICEKAIQNPEVKQLSDCLDNEWYIIRNIIESEIKKLYKNREVKCSVIVRYPNNTFETVNAELDPLTHTVICPHVVNIIKTAINVIHISSSIINLQVKIPATPGVTEKDIVCPLWYKDEVTKEILKNMPHKDMENLYILY